MRIGIFGGTFDPPHVGHWLAAVDAVEALALDEVVWVPAAQQPLKAGVSSADTAHRLAMARLMVLGDTRFRVDAVELERGGLSFTVDTLRAYRERYPDAALFLLLGRDAAASLPKWREPEVIRELAEIVVLTRGGEAASLPSGVRELPTRRVDVSATEIRERVAAGRSIRGFVPDAVAAYIAAHGLYQ
ncbi:MAG: nicotinate (nicotinamide) nucleotide adenylyltransferase [Gemmatimonadetes bacterium]|nr:nicotinate (nicotinamide) nucleotide adenylyltransferase [Gemmatimonadota bacterium]